MISIA